MLIIGPIHPIFLKFGSHFFNSLSLPLFCSFCLSSFRMSKALLIDRIGFTGTIDSAVVFQHSPLFHRRPQAVTACHLHGLNISINLFHRWWNFRSSKTAITNSSFLEVHTSFCTHIFTNCVIFKIYFFIYWYKVQSSLIICYT